MSVSEVGNRPGTGGFAVVTRPPQLHAAQIRRDNLLARMRARLRRPMRPLPAGCTPAPSARVEARVAWPVGRPPVDVALGAPGGVAVLRDDVRRGGFYLHKTLWAIAPSYHGPLLVRGSGRGVRLRLGTGLAPELWVGRASGRPSRWRYGPSTTALPGAGCYAFQVDGTTFSRMIVFRARA